MFMFSEILFTFASLYNNYLMAIDKLRFICCIVFYIVYTLHSANIRGQNIIDKTNTILPATVVRPIARAINDTITPMAASENFLKVSGNSSVIVNYSKSSVHADHETLVWTGGGSSLVFYFPIDGRRLRNYGSNAAAFAALDEQVRSVEVVAALDTIEIVGACSPIGSQAYNLKLALDRCMALRTYLKQTYADFAQTFPIKLSIIGIDSVGYNVLKERNPSLTEKQIWNKLQYAAIRFNKRNDTYTDHLSVRKEVAAQASEEAQQPYVVRDTIYLKGDTVYIHSTEYVNTKELVPMRKPTYIAVKTNLLYDAALLPNITAEWYMGNKWSLALEANWSWWTFDSPLANRWYHQVQTAGIELRRWFKSPAPLQGHALGAYSMIGDYNLRLFVKDKNTMGYSGDLSWSAGLSYAYSLPVARRINIELGVAFGYMGGRYYKYNYCTDHDHWAQRGVYNRSYFGPTRLGVSLVWLVGSGSNE